MKLADVLSKDLVVLDLKETDKRDVLSEMSQVIAGKKESIDKEKLLQVLLEREKLGSTGIGYGVAIPHGKLEGLEDIIILVARSHIGVDFSSLDDEKVHIFFLIVAPLDSPAAHLKILAAISRLLREKTFREKIMDAKEEEEIFKILIEGEENFT